MLDLCGRTTLPQLAALAAESDLVLSNDTGPLHLATAAGARVVGLYTCTSPELNGPYGPDAAAIQSRGLVRGELPEDLRPARLHARADPRPRLAARPEPARRATPIGDGRTRV